jgi:hypothetical protein
MTVSRILVLLEFSPLQMFIENTSDDKHGGDDSINIKDKGSVQGMPCPDAV